MLDTMQGIEISNNSIINYLPILVLVLEISTDPILSIKLEFSNYYVTDTLKN